MLTSSRDIKKRLEQDGWSLERVRGSHHIFRKLGSAAIIVLPHPKKGLGIGLARKIYKQAGWKFD
jgi:predicted RNA binding protein YcfA (HicA-like mRNA interferase family)